MPAFVQVQFTSVGLQGEFATAVARHFCWCSKSARDRTSRETNARGKRNVPHTGARRKGRPRRHQLLAPRRVCPERRGQDTIAASLHRLHRAFAWRGSGGDRRRQDSQAGDTAWTFDSQCFISSRATVRLRSSRSQFDGTRHGLQQPSREDWPQEGEPRE